MLELSKWNSQTDARFGSRRVWAFDLDDTLTHEGVVPSEIFAALEKLQELGHHTVMVSGRPTSWAQPFTKVLPFDAVVAENGAALCFWPGGKLARRSGEEPRSLFWTPTAYVNYEEYLKSAPASERARRMREVEREVFAKFPKMTLASDQAFRIFDLAIDFAESVTPPRPLAEAQAVKKIFESHGAVAKVSSIHVNGWWGDFDKSLGLRTLFANVRWPLGLDTTIYFGDSPNDAPLFAFAPVSVGVANLQIFADDQSWQRPSFITRGRSAHGVLEAMAHYLSAKEETL
jgi:HAD superfamily hydrolase (TIGR01484 family)